jgi:hypothetical protein
MERLELLDNDAQRITLYTFYTVRSFCARFALAAGVLLCLAAQLFSRGALARIRRARAQLPGVTHAEFGSRRRVRAGTASNFWHENRPRLGKRSSRE